MTLLKRILFQKSFCGQEVGLTWLSAYYIVLVFSPYKILLAFISKQTDGFGKAPLVSQPFPFLWAEPHHADVSLFYEHRSWQNDFSNGRSRITAWSLIFLMEKVMAYCFRGSLSHKRICVLYSVVKELWRKRLLSCTKQSQGRKEGVNKSCPACAVYSSSISKSISKSKIIFIIASLIRPFNSISTTI